MEECKKNCKDCTHFMELKEWDKLGFCWTIFSSVSLEMAEICDDYDKKDLISIPA